MEDDERLVKLQRSDSFGYGFSVFGGENCDFPHVVYEVVKNSPADLNGVLEAGDVILEVNERKVKSLTTKEVLKCLRLSNDVVTLKVKKDRLIKARVHEHMAHSNELGALRDSHVSENCTDTKNSHTSIPRYVSSTNGTAKENGENIPPVLSSHESSLSPGEIKPQQRPTQPKFETFMMTGDLIINLNTQSSTSDLTIPVNCKKLSDTVLSNKHSSNPIGDVIAEQKVENKVIKREESDLNSSLVEKKSNYSCNRNFVRTSKSEDYLQKVSVSTVNIDIEDNIATSLNTLLDTNKDNPVSTDRIVWTYNAPVPSTGAKSPPSPTSSTCESLSSGDNSKTNSPIKVNCSVFKEKDDSDVAHVNGTSFVCSISNSNANVYENFNNCNNYVNELVSDKLKHNMFTSVKSRYDPRTIQPKQDGVTNIMVDENKIYVKVLPDRNLVDTNIISVSKSDKILNNSSSPRHLASDICNDQKLSHELNKPDENSHLDDEFKRCYSPTEDESDVESLHSFHYSPKAIDMPSASRLAKRLFNLEGFKKSDVSRHLCKNNDFSRVVAEEYLKFFEFNGESLDVALRKFLKQFCLIGETQERERVLVHFSKRYLDCNPGAFKSQDAVHTLTCALMLLNTDLHGENVGRRMTCGEFVENLAELNEGENFPKDVLKSLYHSIKSTLLEWAVDDEEESPTAADEHANSQDQRQSFIGHNPFLEVPNPNCATEYKKGYVMRKCCIDPNGKKTPIGKRSWKMFYATLRDLVLYLHKDENGFRKNQLYDSLHNSIRIHHALATKATDYTKKRNVFRLQTADQAEYLFQTRYLKDANQDDSKELQSWIDTINYVAASLSAPPLAGGIGSSQKKFQRPLLPVSHSKLNFREQLLDIESGISRLEKELEEHLSHQPDRSAKSRIIHEFVEKEAFLQFELKRYRTYAFLLRSKMAQFPELEPPLVETSIGEVDEPLEKIDVPISPTTTSNNLLNSVNVKRSLSDRYSYRAAIYKTGAFEGSV